jgi:fatty acid desaturase
VDENLSSSARLTRDQLRDLMARRDGPGLALFAVQLAAFVLLSLLVMRLAAAGSVLRWPALVADGLVLLMFFASMHEAGHGTAFATPWLNRTVLWISAPLMLQAPTFFREFHFEHHRRTSDPNGDPEISGAPRYLGVWPANPLSYLAIASGQHVMFGKAVFTIVGAVLTSDAAFERHAPYIRPAFRREVTRQSRLVVALLGGATALGLATVPGFAFWLLAWPVAHVGLGLFVMAEHTGLGSEGSQVHRTRSTRSNALVRVAMWNMPWHAEHHGWPAVPFHALPALSRAIGPELENVAPGYLAFHREALRRSLGTPGSPPA